MGILYRAPRLIPSAVTSSSITPPSIVPTRTYMKNFEEENTGYRPVVAYRNRDRRHFQNKNFYVNRMYIPRYSEVKRMRKFGYESRMNTEGGRRLIMKKILMHEDVLGH